MNNTKKNILAELLAEISPIDQAKTDAKMILASRIFKVLKSKKWNNKDFMEAVGQKNPSVITKWLSGTHNFTVDTLVEIEKALDISLLSLENTKVQKVTENTRRIKKSTVRKHL
ncbi:helix-turn-helix transcriptional regulator [Cryomorpha ignava]|uniref:Helix-turn-helix transcriptional regulator n=1 Tax=Cryomorpha ignava TaxID=101383 RepID=A0A7K3WNU5_9FLAO|nr:helix-turn-helix domain-containing protein [Cryomorpha ignava]NEN22532.1 helix-turn-helix transcriptional regulator [Cryomorpha ignava]